MEGKADDIKTSIDSNDTEGSQVLEKHINYETDRDVMDGTNDKSSNTSTILGDDGKESEKIDDDKRDIFETETKVLQNEVWFMFKI